jgi:hypothetical protein
MYNQLMEDYAKDVVKSAKCGEICREFQGRRVSTEICENSSRPTIARTANSSTLVENAFHNRIMISELQHNLNLQHGKLINIIQDLGFK